MNELEQEVHDRYNDNISSIIEYRQYVAEEKEILANKDSNNNKKLTSIYKKQALALIANLRSPFSNRNKIVSLDSDNASAKYRASINEKLINSIFKREVKGLQVIRDCVSNYIHGNLFVETGWKYKSIKNEIVKDAPYNIQLIERVRENKKNIEVVIDKKKNTMTIYEVKKIINRPFMYSYSIDDVVFDATAKITEPLQWFIIEYKYTISEIETLGLFNSREIKKIKSMKKDLDIEYGSNENIDARYKVLKYYRLNSKNNVDIHYLASVDGGNFRLVNSNKDALPISTIPITIGKLYDIDNKIIGKSLYWAIEEEDKDVAKIKKAIKDNLARSNFGMTFIKKNTLDKNAMSKFLAGNPIVEINTRDNLHNVIQQGNFTPLPQSVFALMDKFNGDASETTGISSHMLGVGSNDIKAPASNYASLMHQSQIRLDDAMSNLTDSLKQVFTIWVQLFNKYYTDEDIKEITRINIEQLKKIEYKKLSNFYGIDELPEDVKEGAKTIIAYELENMFNDKYDKYDITIKVSSKGAEQIKIQNLLMLAQQIGPLMSNNVIGSEATKQLVIELADLLGEHTLAQIIKRDKPQGNPMQEQAMQIQMQGEQAKAQKEQALAQNAMARTELTNAKAKEAHASIEPNVSKKYMEVAKESKEIAEGDDNGKDSKNDNK